MAAPIDDAAAQPTSLKGVVRVARAWLHGGWRAARDVDPEFWRNLQRELLAGRQWADRAVVLVYAAATGAIVVAFTLLAEAAIHGFRQVEAWGDHGRYFTLLWTPALTVVLLWWTRRFVPGAGGSGIPQVVRALEEDLPPPQSAWLVSMRVSLHKIGLVSGGLLAGCPSVARAPRSRSVPASWSVPDAGCRRSRVSTRTT